MSWVNADGLEIKFGTEQAKNAKIGEYRYDGGKHCVAIQFDYSDMPAVASNSTLIADNFSFPIGAVFEHVEIVNWVDMDSTSDDMTLNVGWIDTDRSGGIDVDAFVVAATQTELNTGGTDITGWIGAAIAAAPLTAPKLITWEVDNHAASAGSGEIRIYYSVAVD